jgi:hypothetical protein
MKKLIWILCIATGMLSLPGCSTNFNVAAPYKAITVVYGLLDQADTAHYIIVEKAFLDQNKSAITMAQVPDSSYYSMLNVRIERINSDGSETIYDTIHLNRVDLNTEGYPRKSGPFFTSPNYAYKFTNKLDPNYFYRLVIYNPATGEVDSAETPVIDDIDKSAFSLGTIQDTFPLPAFTLDFASTLQTQTVSSLQALYYAPSNYSFMNEPSPVQFAECVITFRWVDSNSFTRVETPHSADYDLGYLTTAGTSNRSPNYSPSSFTFQPLDLNLYYAIRNGMGTAPANTYRLMDSCDLKFYLGSFDLYTYQLYSLTQGVGLTGGEIEPSFTNMKGAHVLGIFTSRGHRIKRVPIDDVTIDSLRTVSFMSGYNIIGKTLN